MSIGKTAVSCSLWNKMLWVMGWEKAKSRLAETVVAFENTYELTPHVIHCPPQSTLSLSN
jgi:hypothetical protein